LARFDRFSNNKFGDNLLKERTVQACDVVIISRKEGAGEGVDRKRELERVKAEAVRSEEAREKEVSRNRGMLVENKSGMGSKENVVKRKESEGVTSWKYLPLQEDLIWASQCYIAKLKTDYNVVGIQQALSDAGFMEFRIITLGGDNVLLHPRGKGKSEPILPAAYDLLNNFFIDFKPWSREDEINCVRGAWVRCYGVPIVAWNSIFFAELAETQGNLLMIDEVTINKDRMDFARILITTSSLKEINTTVKVLIDNKDFYIRLVEDWGHGFANDVCLGELEDDNNSHFSDHSDLKADEPFVEEFVQQLHEQWSKEIVHDCNNGLPTQ
jgi:hypothetical protein